LVVAMVLHHNYEDMFNGRGRVWRGADGRIRPCRC
jgi:hypothetical protein